MSAAQGFLVFSDLDGSLLDHFSYRYLEALPAVDMLRQLSIPLILVSSKTCAEIVALRRELGNTAPFIVENGAAVFVPCDHFKEQPHQTRRIDDYWVCEFGDPREFYVSLLDELSMEFPGCYETFVSAGIAGVAAMTGLSKEQAALASDRHYSEPVKWTGAAEEEARFIRRIEQRGASVTRGGRFLSISGDCDKGRALAWLRCCYESAGGQVQTLGVGDSANDRSMLEAADYALLVRSPVHDFPVLARSERVMYSELCGPAGWNEGVSRWLAENGLTD